MECTAVNVGTYIGGGIFSYTCLKKNRHTCGGIGTRLLEQRELLLRVVGFQTEGEKTSKTERSWYFRS